MDLTCSFSFLIGYLVIFARCGKIIVMMYYLKEKELNDLVLWKNKN